MVKNIPINIFFSIISALVIFIITPLYAQEIPSDIANMLTAQQLEDLKARADQNSGAKDNNLPVAKMPEQKNIKDLKITNTNALKYDAEDAEDAEDVEDAIFGYKLEKVPDTVTKEVRF